MQHSGSGGQDGGFSLVELLIVLAIIGVLLGIAVASYMPASAAAAASACRHNQRVLEEAAMTLSYTERPDELLDLSSSVGNWDSASVCPADGTTLQFDAATLDVSCPNHP